MTILSADFELGTVPNGLSTGDAGSLTAWSSVSVGGGGAIRYSNAQAAHGSKSVQFVGANSSGAGTLGMAGLGSLSDWYGRCYVLYFRNPSTSTDRFVFNSAVPATQCGLVFNFDLTVSLMDINFLNKVTTSVPLQLGRWNRIEWRFTQVGTNTGSGELRTYASMDSVNPTNSITASAASFGLSTESFQLTQNDIGPLQQVFFDQLVLGSLTPVGPYPKCSSVPLIHGTFTVGSTVTCDSGIWNDGIRSGCYQGNQYQTLTYQWKRDGVDIVGQTGQTYTLASDDVGHYVQCKVTATSVLMTNETASVLSAGVLI